jgi:putative redox protein
LSADEPREHGGDDAGLTPYDQLLASLGACISMTIRMLAAHKQLPLQPIEVTLRHDKIYARDCKDCEINEGKIDRIERPIVLQKDLH